MSFINLSKKIRIRLQTDALRIVPHHAKNIAKLKKEKATILN